MRTRTDREVRIDELILAAVKSERPKHDHLSRRVIKSAVGMHGLRALTGACIDPTTYEIAKSLQRLQSAQRIHFVVYGVSGWTPIGWRLAHHGWVDELGEKHLYPQYAKASAPELLAELEEMRNHD
jgi:hypothetical protein